MAKTSEVSSAQLDWLRREVAGWEREGLVDEAGAASLLGRDLRQGGIARIKVDGRGNASVLDVRTR